VNAGGFVRLDGGDSGSRPPLVLVHGVGLDHTMWDLVVGGLAADRLVIRYDLLGHGRSTDPPAERSLDDFVDQCLAVVEAHTGSVPDVAGHSLGGMIALGLAARHPGRLGRLALLNTVFDRTPAEVHGARERLALAGADGLGPIADLAVDRWFDEAWQEVHPEMVASVRNRLASNDPAGYLEAYRVFVDGDPLMPAGAAGVTATTLALTGELDPGSTPAMGDALAAAIPDCSARVLPGLHHLPPVEAPAEFVAALLDFLDRPCPSTTPKPAREATR
jgi:pimeloyl-ACP methyl ester carboxylesterase